jgi:hypothetical protein
VKVWISPARFQFSSNFDVVRDDLGRAYYVPSAVRGRTEDGLVKYEAEHPLLMISAHVAAAQRASKNRLVDLFCKLREAQGWTINRVDARVPSNKDRSEAERALWNEHAKGLLSARVLDEPDYVDLSAQRERGDPLVLDERLEYERNTLERTLNVTLSYDIIKLNYDGRLIDRTATLSLLVRQWKGSQLLVQHQLAALAEPLARLPKMTSTQLLHCVLAASGLCDEAGICRDVQIDAAQLISFIELCERNQTVLEELLNQSLRKDIRLNPVRQLNVFLKLAGLKLAKVKRQKRAGKGTRFYGFEQPRFDIMRALAANYRDPREIVEECRLAQKAA